MPQCTSGTFSRVERAGPDEPHARPDRPPPSIDRWTGRTSTTATSRRQHEMERELASSDAPTAPRLLLAPRPLASSSDRVSSYAASSIRPSRATSRLPQPFDPPSRHHLWWIAIDVPQMPRRDRPSSAAGARARQSQCRAVANGRATIHSNATPSPPVISITSDTISHAPPGALTHEAAWHLCGSLSLLVHTTAFP
jgi:hypothetical protein